MPLRYLIERIEFIRPGGVVCYCKGNHRFWFDAEWKPRPGDEVVVTDGEKTHVKKNIPVPRWRAPIRERSPRNFQRGIET